MYVHTLVSRDHIKLGARDAGCSTAVVPMSGSSAPRSRAQTYRTVISTDVCRADSVVALNLQVNDTYGERDIGSA